MQDNQFFEEKISEYYNSVKDSFFYWRINSWKANTAWLFYFFAVLFFFMNLIPVMPSKDGYLLWIFNMVKNNFTVEIEEYSFWIRWALGIIFSALLLGILFIPFKFWDTKKKKKFVKTSNLRFCYAYTLRKDLESYLINENNSHLDNISEYFQKVFSNLVLTPYVNKWDKDKQIPIYELRNTLVAKYDWIEFGKQSNDLIDSFASIVSKIEKRIHQKAELEKVVPFIDVLILYEFSFIKPNLKDSRNIELKEHRLEFLVEMQKELNKLDQYDGLNETVRTKKTEIKSVLSFVEKLFTSSNILFMFLSWLILLTIIFIASSILILNKVSIEVDSTILIGLLSAPFLGAITLTATIYSKNKK